MIGPEADFGIKARHLRAMYRSGGPAESVRYATVRAEHRRLFPQGEERLDLILVDAWIEGHKLAGQRYDVTRQAWVGPDGKVVKR